MSLIVCERYHETNNKIPLNIRIKYIYELDGTNWYRCKWNERVKNTRYNKVTEKLGVTTMTYYNI